MSDSRNYPREWTERIPAEVFACLVPGEMRIILLPGVGLANFGAPRDVPMDLVPFDLRVPNARLWVQMDEHMRDVIRVWRREE
jgi:hypothetical protein